MSSEITAPEAKASKETFWRRVLQEWNASGLTGREFQRRNNLSEHAFIYWKLKLIGVSDKKSRLVPVRVPCATRQPERAEGIRIRVGQLFSVELAGSYDATRLREVLAAVRECAQ